MGGLPGWAPGRAFGAWNGARMLSTKRMNQSTVPADSGRGSGFRVAFFHRSRVFGGAEESLLTNANEFLRRGLEVVVICSLDGAVADRLREAGLQVRRLLPRSHFRARQHSLLRRVSDSVECRSQSRNSSLAGRVVELVIRAELAGLDAALRDLKPSVFYSNMCAGGDHPFLKRAARLGIPTVSHQRVTPPVWTGRRVVREANAFCDWFVSNSAWTRLAWLDCGLRAERHDVVYNTILKPRAAKESLRERLSLGPDAKLIASLGRLEPTKRFDDGIRAFAEVAGRFPEWHLLIMGDGAERAQLEQVASAAAPGVAERIHFLGSVPQAASCLEQVEVLLHPTPAEHFGRVIAEAMLAGATVIGHASGGVTEMVEDGITGHLFQDARSMRDCLERVMTHGPDAAMRDRASRHIEKLCGPDNAEILTRLIESTGGKRQTFAVQHEHI